MGLALASVLVLTGCAVDSNAAVRINSDGTVDFLSCEPLASLDSVTARTYERRSEETVGELKLDGTVPSSIEVGDVLHFTGLAPLDAWDGIEVLLVGESATASSESETVSWISGTFTQSSLEVGEWEWVSWTANRCEPTS